MRITNNWDKQRVRIGYHRVLMCVKEWNDDIRYWLPLIILDSLAWILTD